MSNISNLLRYNVADIQYQYHITNATISAGQNFPTHNTQFRSGELSIHTEQPQLRQDSTAFFASIGLHKLSDLMDNAAEKGRQAVLEATANYGKIADQMAEIDKGVTPAQIYHQKLLEQTETSLVVKSAAQINLSYTPGKVDTQYKPSSVSFEWNVARAPRQYSAANFRLDVLRDPSINFIYQGGFQYVPESATPGFSRMA
ncbi:MAG TPA: DUF6470 family protein [Clostridia bacterium]|nr:DUF6470 family protein [Clostridia bacterium]